MIGMSAVPSSDLSTRHRSKPDAPGISTSSRMRSGRGSPAAISSAVPASEAVSTRYSAASAFAIRASRSVESSTARITGRSVACAMPQVYGRRCGSSAAPRAALGVGEQPRVRLGRERLAEVEALQLVALVAPQEPQLSVGLDALGDHLEVQGVAERDDGLRDHALLRFGAGADVAHERAVDLERVERQVLQ